MTAPAPARISARRWGWRHAGRRRWAVHALDLEVGPGERVLLLGPSGAGKSTLLAALAGLLHGTDSGEAAGHLLIDGVAAHENRHRSGLVMQDPDSQIVMARIGDEVAFGPENYGVDRTSIWARVDEALAMVGLGYPLDRSTAALSGGEKQRLALAGVLATRPGLLLLDEPTANLDPAGAAEIRGAVGSVLERTGSTLVVVEHRIDAWLPIIDRIVALDADGALLVDGPPEQVISGHAGALTAAGVWLPGRRRRPVAVRPAAPQASPLIEAEQVRLRYRASTTDAVRSTDLDLTRGRARALTGPNGSGKSSLAGMVCGLVAPTGGGVRAADRPRQPLHRRRSASLASLVGTVFQNPEHQFLTSSVRAELELAPRRLGLPARQTQARVDALLERLRLDELAQANPFTLSGGQKRRLSVGTALSAAAPVLVLDEPTFGQDATTWAELVALLLELRDEGAGMLIVSHDEQFVDLVADDVLTMSAGVMTQPS